MSDNEKRVLAIGAWGPGDPAPVYRSWREAGKKHSQYITALGKAA